MMFKNLLNIRELYNLTQNDMSEILNVNRATYSKWETGSEIIPLNTLNIISNHFKMSLDYLIGLNNNTPFNHSDLNSTKIGNRIKELRIKNGYTQKALANLLNTTQSTISAYESGKTLILTVFAYQLALKFNVSMDYLCGKIEK